MIGLFSEQKRPVKTSVFPLPAIRLMEIMKGNLVAL